MFEKIKKYGLQIVVLLVNVSLVGGGVAYFKNKQDKKNEAADLAAEAAQQEIAEASAIDPVAEKAQELQGIIEKNTQQKTESIANNPASVPVQVPKTVTQTVPGGTKTVTTTKPSSSSTPAPKKTTKNS